MRTKKLVKQDLKEINGVSELSNAAVLQDKVLRMLQCPHRRDMESNVEVELMIEILKKSIELTTQAERLIKGDVM